MAEDQKHTIARRSERIGKYEILEYVAKGGMGIVYKARDTALDRVVALKVLPPELARQATMLDRFRREARAAARLRHENIVAIYDVDEAAGTWYLAMEFVPGTDLGNYIHKKGKLSPGKARMVITQAARALDAAHREGIVHRDIKPANFLLTFGRDKEVIVKLTDMGLARHTEEQDETRLTKHGMTVGTVDYMSPEQARNSADADIRSDIYSLGCTLYHMLAGEPPFPKGTLTERLLQHQEVVPPDIRKVNPAVPDFLARIMMKMVAKKPTERYQTPAELLHDLEHPEKLSSEKITAPATPAPATPTPAPATPTPAPTLTAPVGDEDVDLFSSLPASSIAPAAPTEPPTPSPAAPSRPTATTPAPTPRVPEVSSYEVKFEPGDRIERPIPSPPPATPRPARPSGTTRKVDKAGSSPSQPKAPGSKSPPRPAKPSKIRFRDEEVDEEDELEESEEPQAPKAKSRPHQPAGKQQGAPPVPLIVGAGVGVVVIILLLIGTSGHSRREDTKKEEPPAPKITIAPRQEEPEPPPAVAKVDQAALAMGPERMPLPAMGQAAIADRTALRRDYCGPFTAFPKPPADAKVVRISRTAAPGAASFRSLADALAKTADAETTVLEIHDQGPLFVPSLPAVSKRRLFLRGGEGYRPLVAWESPTGALLTLASGELVLEDIDIVAAGDADKAGTALFNLRGASLQARNCTFSIAGKHKGGLALANLEGIGSAETRGVPQRFHLQRCYGRGSSLVAVRVDNTPAEVLIEDSLLLSSRGPLLEGRSRDDEAIELRFVRSTLVSGQNLIMWRSPAKGGTPLVHGHVLDSILAHTDATATDGDLVRLTDGATPRLMSWRAMGGVYAGWRRLLASDGRAVSGGDLEGWHSQFYYRELDRALVDTWPVTPPAQPDELPAQALAPYDAPLAFAARSSSGGVGCAVGALPVEPADWQRRTFVRHGVSVIAGNDSAGVPAIPRDADGLYHGERIDVNQVSDLGQHLQKLLQPGKVGPRVVFHLAGTGTALMSPVRVRGVSDLIFYFEPAKGTNAQPLSLELDPRSTPGQQALFDVDGGSLEFIGARLRYPNVRTTPVPPYMLKVNQGDLRLTRCQLFGPLAQSPEAFRALVSFGGAGPDADRPRLFSVRDSLLLSGKSVVQLPAAGSHVRAKNNIAMALTSALDIDVPARLGRAGGIACVFERNTWAVRQAFVSLHPGKALPARVEPVAIQTTGDYFVDPFDPGGQAALLRFEEPAIARGLLLWHGRKNAFDQRLNGYFAPLAPATAEKQALKDWLTLWGPDGEAEPMTVAPAQNPRLVFLNPDFPQLDRLALPRIPGVDPLQPPAGAELPRLAALWAK